MPLLMVLGCAIKPRIIEIRPIYGTDFCVKGQSNCNMCNMDIGMSEFYFNKVLELKGN